MSKRSEVREKRRRQKQRQQLTLGLIVVGVILIVVAIIILPSLKPIGEIIVPEFVERPMVEGTAMGDPQAPVIMEVFSDYTCSHCQRFSHETQPLLVDQYVTTGQVYIVNKNFALYPTTVKISEAALCAAEQGKFWEYDNVLFANQNPSDPNAYSDRRLIAFAEVVDLDTDVFEDCINDRRYNSDVEKSRVEAQNLGITGTPSFLINGKLIVGNIPLEEFQQEIEAALGGR